LSCFCLETAGAAYGACPAFVGRERCRSFAMDYFACRDMQVDKEIRKLRERALERVDAKTIRSVLQACIEQQCAYQERRSSGCLTTSWLAAPRPSMTCSQVLAGSMHGAVSLAGPCMDGVLSDGFTSRENSSAPGSLTRQ
jgi:hypothetical protein